MSRNKTYLEGTSKCKDGAGRQNDGQSSQASPHQRDSDASCEGFNFTVNINFRNGVPCNTGSGSTCRTGCSPGSGSGGGGGSVPGGSGRPTHQTGTSDGTIKDGAGSKGGIIMIPTRPSTQWPGTRSELYLPFLAIRAWPGDTAARPIQGPFWESPDIFITPGVKPSEAPDTPPDYAATAQAGVDNTVYVHVWNLGQAPCYGALAEFYWFNPTMGFNRDAAHLIGKTFFDLGSRFGTNSHKLVKCPFSWVARFENGGHECLVVRVSHAVTDPLSNPPWDASTNRHIGQRNIHVMTAAEAAARPTLPINIGPMFGQPGQVAVRRAETKTMPWLHLVNESRREADLPTTGAADGVVGISAPVANGARVPFLGNNPDPRGTGMIEDNHELQARDDLQVGFVSTDGNPGGGKANVYRVSGTQNGQIFGGYTVVVLGS